MKSHMNRSTFSGVLGGGWNRLPILVSALFVAGLAHAQLAIQSITAATQAGSDVIRIQTNGPVKEAPKGFAIQSPARIALDFAGTTNGLGRNAVEFNQGNLRSANVVEAGDRTRVVLNLGQAANYQTRIEGNTVLVLLEPKDAAAPAQSAAKATFAEGRNADVQPLSDIDFRRGVGGTGRVVVNLANDQVGVDIRQQGKNLVVEFLKTTLPEGLRRRMDVSDFGTPVQTVTTTQVGDRVRMVVEPRGAWEHSAYQSGNQFVLEVREQKVDVGKLTAGPGYSGEKLSLNFQNIEVRSLLQVIADFTNFNIVTSDTVTGNVTLRLKDVPWDQALDIILQAKGLGMRKSGNVIWIAPKDEIAAREKMDFEAKATVQTLEPVQTRSFQMNYAKADAVAMQLMGAPVVGARAGAGGAAAAPVVGAGGAAGANTNARMLSPRGSAIAEMRTNQLFVTDIPSKLDAIQELIKKVDIPVRQVMIEARIVEATDTFSRNLGVRLGVSTGPGYGTVNNNRVTFGGSYDALTAQQGIVNGGTTSFPDPTASLPFVNLPAAAIGSVNPSTFALSLFGPSAQKFLNLEISALEEDGLGKVVSSPRVITADQTLAEIEQGVEIPYQSAASSGATTVQFRKAVLRLSVTPQITPDGGIILDVEVTKDTPGTVYVGGVAVNTKRVKTNVLVENGGTVVIGGIFTSTEQDTVDKVPLLGDLPVVGNLFKSRQKQNNKSELLVFLTPRTMSDVINANNR